METLIGKGTHEKTAELDTLVTNGMSYFRQAVDLYGEHSGLEVSLLRQRVVLAALVGVRKVRIATAACASHCRTTRTPFIIIIFYTSHTS